MTLDINETPPPLPPSQGRTVLRGFLVASAISAGIALLGAALLRRGEGLIIIAPFGLLQLLWTLPLFLFYRGRGNRGEAKGALLSCAFNIVASVACWGIVLSN